MTIEEIFFSLIRSELRGEKISEEIKNLITDESYLKLYKLAKAHDLVHLIADALDKNGLLPTNERARNSFLQARNSAIYRYEQQRYEYESILETLRRARIPHIPLKGSILRDYYPEGWMRTSCDIDVLVKKDDIQKAIEILTKELEYTHEYGCAHDESLYSPGGVHLELHHILLEDSVNAGAADVLEDVWAVCSPVGEDEFFFKMTNEVFYFYHIVHSAKHFLSGGCGVRPFVDLWIMERRWAFDFEVLDGLLEKSNLLTFTEAARKLSRVWLDGESADERTLLMQEYLLSGGVYGTQENKVALQQARQGGKWKYALSRIFQPYEQLKYRYPILQRHKWLTPFCEVARWFTFLFGSERKRALRHFEINATTTDDNRVKMDELVNDLGLSK